MIATGEANAYLQLFRDTGLETLVKTETRLTQALRTVELEGIRRQSPHW